VIFTKQSATCCNIEVNNNNRFKIIFCLEQYVNSLEKTRNITAILTY